MDRIHLCAVPYPCNLLFVLKQQFIGRRWQWQAQAWMLYGSGSLRGSVDTTCGGGSERFAGESGALNLCSPSLS